MSEEKDNATQLNPFKLIRRGQDSLGPEDDVQFADFSPQMLPADAPEDSPKGASAMAPVQSKGSRERTEPSNSETPAPEPANKDDGQSNTSEDSKQTSSSEKKGG